RRRPRKGRRPRPAGARRPGRSRSRSGCPSGTRRRSPAGRTSFPYYRPPCADGPSPQTPARGNRGGRHFMDEPLQKYLERYDPLDRIAVGGMAEVFLAKAHGAHGSEKTLAIKRILPELARDPEFEARFIAEAKVAVKLSHANVVQVLDFGRIGESLFIAMEYV